MTARWPRMMKRRTAAKDQADAVIARLTTLPTGDERWNGSRLKQHLGMGRVFSVLKGVMFQAPIGSRPLTGPAFGARLRALRLVSRQPTGSPSPPRQQATDMSDIVSFCREHAGSYGDLRRYCETPIALDRAADEIERLRAELAARDAEIVAWFEWTAKCTEADLEEGLWEGIEDDAEDFQNTCRMFADAFAEGRWRDDMPKVRARAYKDQTDG